MTETYLLETRIKEMPKISKDAIWERVTSCLAGTPEGQQAYNDWNCLIDNETFLEKAKKTLVQGSSCQQKTPEKDFSRIIPLERVKISLNGIEILEGGQWRSLGNKRAIII